MLENRRCGAKSTVKMKKQNLQKQHAPSIRISRGCVRVLGNLVLRYPNGGGKYYVCRRELTVPAINYGDEFAVGIADDEQRRIAKPISRSKIDATMAAAIHRS